MRAVSKTDGQGNFAGDVLLIEGAPLPAGCIESRPPEGFHAPRWTGSAWEEGKPASEILEGLKAAKVDEMAEVIGVVGLKYLEKPARRARLRQLVAQNEPDEIRRAKKRLGEIEGQKRTHELGTALNRLVRAKGGSNA